jgi:hypothetical protein
MRESVEKGWLSAGKKPNVIWASPTPARHEMTAANVEAFLERPDAGANRARRALAHAQSYAKKVLRR